MDFDLYLQTPSIIVAIINLSMAQSNPRSNIKKVYNNPKKYLNKRTCLFFPNSIAF